jgi:hypothetical protein
VRASVHDSGRHIRLSWPLAGTFVARDGRLAAVRPAPGASARTVRLFLNGPVAAVLLRQQGFVVLHASAVRLEGSAVLFLGASGRGKSTIAAALVQRGHRLITDDVAAVDSGTGGLLVLPGVAELKLWPDSAGALGRRAERLPRVRPGVEKRALSTAGRGVACPVPLRRVYVLTQGERLALEPLAPCEALIELIRHSYGPQTLRAVRPAVQFTGCGRIATEIPVARLIRPAGLAHLADLARIVETDID